MASDAYVLSRRAIETLKSDHAKLRAQIQGLQQEVARNLSADGDYGKQIATGITSTTSQTPSYPTSGNVVPVKIEKWNFTESTGSQDIDYTAGTKYVMARTYDGTLPALGTHVVIERQQGRPGRRWWIRTAPASTLPRAFYYSGSTFSTNITMPNTDYVLRFIDQQNPAVAPTEVLYNAATSEWTVNGTSKWMHHLQGMAMTRQAITAGRTLQVRMWVSWNTQVPAQSFSWTTPGGPALWALTQYSPVNVSETRNHHQISSQQQVDGRRFRVVAKVIASTSSPIDVAVSADLHWSEIKQGGNLTF